MQYVKFGNTGMEVSRLCLGCMSFPNQMDVPDAEKLLDSALERGINFLDTADAYRASEEVLGKILKDKRDNIILATKLWLNIDKRPNGGGCSRVHIMQQLERSLRLLKTDYVDIYQLHHPDANTPVEETISTLDTLVKQGKIRYIGVSNHYAWQMAHMLGVSALHNWEPLVSVQCRYNIMDRAVENEIMPFVQRFNIATMIYSPLDGGTLTGKYHRNETPPQDSRWGRNQKMYEKKMTDNVFDVLEELEKLAAKYEVGMNQLAIAWVLSKPYCTTAIMGGYKPEHFDTAYNALEIKLDPEDVAYIDEISESFRYRPFHNQAVVQGAPAGLNYL